MREVLHPGKGGEDHGELPRVEGRGVGEDEVVEAVHEGAALDGMANGRRLETQEASKLGGCQGSMNLQTKHKRVQHALCLAWLG